METLNKKGLTEVKPVSGGEGVEPSRREFLKSSAFVGGVILSGVLTWTRNPLTGRLEASVRHLDEYPLNKAENVIYSVCLNCHTGCTIKVKHQEGVAVKIDGNPYSPMNVIPHLPEEVSPRIAAQVDAKLCPKGQAAVQVLYDPYRLRKVLKRKPGTYRGPVQHTNGYYNAQAIITLNALIGNIDWKGGLTQGGGHWHEDGSAEGQPFPKSVIKSAPGGFTAFGVKLTREGTHYEDTTLFQRDGYPAKRPWYPFTDNVYHEIIPSAEDGYPYPIKCLFIHKGTPVLASPAGHDNIRVLRDPKKIPLVIACDVVIGETSMYADYIIPDLTFLERWGTPHASPDVPVKVSKFRQPAASPLTEIVKVDGEEMPISMEAFLIAVGKKLGLPGFGKDAFGPGWNFDRPEDFYLKLAANIAFGDKADGSEKLPPADEEEMRIFREARKHLPKAVFDEEKWKRAVPADLWPRVVYLLNRGGRFEPYEKAYKGDKMGHPWAGVWHLFAEKVSKGRNSLTGERFSGLPVVEPPKDAKGQIIQVGPEYDLHLITYKEIVVGQSRTHGAYWIQYGVLPENFILMNRKDAEARGLRDGDRVKIVSPTLPDGTFPLGDGRTYAVVGKVKVVEGIRPGTIAVSWGYGHWAYGSNDVEVDGKIIRGDRRRASGVVPNPAMLLDPVLKNVCLTDPIGGSASFYDTPVRLVRV